MWVEVFKKSPRERVSDRIVEQIVAVPQILERAVEVDRSTLEVPVVCDRP